MSVLIFLDQAEGKLKKSAFEVASYGAKVAELTGTEAIGVVIGKVTEDLSLLGKYGLKKVVSAADEKFDHFDSEIFTGIIAETAKNQDAKILILANNFNGKAIAPRLSVKLKAGLVTGAMALPDVNGGFVVKKSVFSGKAFVNVNIKTDIKIISLNANSYKIQEGSGAAGIESITPQTAGPRVSVKGTEVVKGEVPLAEAELVVSGGRGLKGPEHWGIVTDLAHALGAATACSRPVSDSGWRPHSEHVGQTGLAIAPNLYVAIGISGAIQHLAGVNRSKTIVVINKDPEAPFFKAADYGIVGDAFDVVPKITEAVRKLKAAQL